MYIMDNVASDPAQPLAQPEDDYLKRFDIVAAHGIILRDIADSIANCADQDARLAAALSFIAAQQKYNDELYDLVVEIHNNLTH